MKLKQSAPITMPEYQQSNQANRRREFLYESVFEYLETNAADLLIDDMKAFLEKEALHHSQKLQSINHILSRLK
ncbi:MAG: hypothetical protein P8Y72_01855 [Anaerolineales bacterium]|jgi:hypothetical protein